jgi:ankyrin repeat protein
MSDALPLPPHPSLDQYRKLAKEFRDACDSGDIRAWAERWTSRNLDDPDAAERMVRMWRRLRREGPCTLTGAQFALARFHGFDSWPKFTRHLDSLRSHDSPISRFESAADAVVTGNGARLEALLSRDPDLIRARSTREHRSTLLHYVSANGVENFRQKTPANIVAIANRLLAAGADVEAESDAYGGGCTVLGLTATSYPPQAAGVQAQLLQLLLEHGASIPRGAIVSCLANGRSQAAEFLATRGAPVDLEGAAGIGRLDLVESLFDGATPTQVKDAFTWACEFGRTSVVAFLCDRGVDVAAKLPRQHGQTGLHWAAYGGHAETVALLLERGAPVDVKDDRFDSTPLEWALFAWGQTPPRGGAESYYEVIRRLARSGASLDPNWGRGDRQRERALARVLSDVRMASALRGER